MKYTISVEWDNKAGYWEWKVFPSDMPEPHWSNALHWGYTFTRWGGFNEGKKFIRSIGYTTKRTKEIEV
jgi:hypothetical protein